MIKFHVYTDISELEAAKLALDNSQKILLSQVQKDTAPFVPMKTGSLNQRTHIVGDMIIYPGPYARYLYYGKVMVDSVTGKGPFYIPEIGYRFRKGAILKPTGRDLVFDKSAHPLATARWFEVSKARNLKRWLAILQKAVTHGK